MQHTVKNALQVYETLVEKVRGRWSGVDLLPALSRSRTDASVIEPSGMPARTRTAFRE
jgi:hypothetical protein